MNREIKFKGQPTGKGGVWMVGIGAYKTHTAEHLVLNAKGDYVEVVHLCQYTGLKDKNGKEIYEGDIVAETGNIIGSIFLSARYGVSIQKNSTTWSLINFCVDSDFDCGTLSNIEVIGSIHKNPELLCEK